MYCVAGVCIGTRPNLHAVSFQAEDLARIVRNDAQFFHAEIGENLRTDAVIAFVDRQTERDICLHGVRALILQLICAKLVGQADSSPFLPQIQKDATAFFGDNFHCAVALCRTIAAQRVQGVTRETFGVNAYEQVFAVADLAHYQCDVRVSVDRIFKRISGPLAQLRRKRKFSDPVQQFFGTPSVSDEIFDRDEFERMFFREFDQTIEAFHRAVFRHDFADDARRIKSRQSGQIRRTLPFDPREPARRRRERAAETYAPAAADQRDRGIFISRCS